MRLFVGVWLQYVKSATWKVEIPKAGYIGSMTKLRSHLRTCVQLPVKQERNERDEEKSFENNPDIRWGYIIGYSEQALDTVLVKVGQQLQVK